MLSSLIYSSFFSSSNSLAFHDSHPFLLFNSRHFPSSFPRLPLAYSSSSTSESSYSPSSLSSSPTPLSSFPPTPLPSSPTPLSLLFSFISSSFFFYSPCCPPPLPLLPPYSLPPLFLFFFLFPLILFSSSCLFFLALSSRSLRSSTPTQEFLGGK